MAHKQYPDIAAARHMKDTPLEPQKGTGRGKRADASASPAKPATAPLAKKDKAYRKKRFVALVLTTLVCLSVPTLITLLVLFG
ncbi:hypothetical protein OL239_07210 [Arthrobacter sp. ATA002]|uniref:hypothetical protein n=1 Tax=Arthrobacter sp. ATA002 TaxID=2991715 RepID=UPI0022A758D0|nr:hypothetical protein [Arthrobacter sp. ATA002]WAP52917.1 hypothetical protein OL239_07210 [Arthrobacter sp. ATA002]